MASQEARDLGVLRSPNEGTSTVGSAWGTVADRAVAAIAQRTGESFRSLRPSLSPIREIFPCLTGAAPAFGRRRLLDAPGNRLWGTSAPISLPTTTPKQCEHPPTRRGGRGDRLARVLEEAIGMFLRRRRVRDGQLCFPQLRVRTHVTTPRGHTLHEARYAGMLLSYGMSSAPSILVQGTP